ncbi:HAD family hydrolase [Vulcaniibacterium tengchongense]|uniref:Putative hydrolase of the HAD superfamily n=1 Tax=Vulcaniibacterium tengchongense TaxID=1273429 RepID=A0A3N4VD59_9GAMM|nr:HAD-IA family hydrolase [Vulcaniibacterium tengchongense]RPE79733.1 putative hydrolase of the HAD superfamily [Vulcaniibacterium tengchongense]
MRFPVRAITLDLDDTLWPFAPIGARVERVLHEWLLRHCPNTARCFPVEAMRELRQRLHLERPDLAHDLSELRRLTLVRAMELAGDDPALADVAFEAFHVERNRVEFYPDALPALQRLAARVPLAAVSNGNADLARIGIDRHFAFQLGAREHGAAKPAASIFHAACAQLALAPHEVLHVGDHVEMDVLGAHRAGLRCCWLNRDGQAWPHAQPRPDLEFTTLAELADWLDAAHTTPDTVAA